MSWLSENYEKAALGVAAIAVVAVGYFVVSGGEKTSEPTVVKPKNITDIPEMENLMKANKKLNSEYAFVSKKDKGNEITSFVAYPLFSIKGQPEITPLSDDYPIHKDMPIKWWNKYNLNDYTQENGPELDPDKDGFTNREEKDAGTNPTLAEDRPNYLTKLQCDEITSSKYEISWTQAGPGQGNFLFKYNGFNYRYNNLAIGAKFPDGKFKRNKNFVNRFEITAKGQDPAKPGELGQFFEINDIIKNAKFKAYYKARDKDKVKFNDWKAKMSVDINVAGVNKQFSLSEGDKFNLPYDLNDKNKPFKFLFLKDGKLLFEHNVKELKSPLELVAPKPKER